MKCARKTDMFSQTTGPQKKAILYSSEEWAKLLSYLSEKQKQEENVENNRLELLRRKEMSKELEDSFSDSREQLRLQVRLKREKFKYEKEFKKIEELKKKENLKIIEETKRALRKNKDGYKALDSALRLADTLRERKKQQEFQDQIKSKEKELEKTWNDKILQDAREFQEDQKKEKQEKIIRKNQSFQQCTQNLKERQEERRRLRQLELQEEITSIEKVKREIKDIEEEAKATKEKTRRIADEMTRESFLLDKKKRDKETEEEEFDKAAFHIIKQTTRHLTDMKNEIMQRRYEAEEARRDKIHNYMASIMKAAKDNEDERIRKVKEADDEKLMTTLKLDHEKKARMAKDKVESFQKYLREVEEAKKQREEIIKWEMLKRCKMLEHDKMKEEEKIAMERKKKQNQREDLDKQLEEQRLIVAEVLDADCDAVNRSVLLWKINDVEVMKYGNKVLQEDCEKKQRPTLPVVKAITDYQRKNRLVPPPSKNLSQWESNVFPRPFPPKPTQTNS